MYSFICLSHRYTFGAPRVGRGDFVKSFKEAVHAPFGSSWRIVNNKDLVPKVPASLPWPFSRDPFIHVDAGYKIYPDANPNPMPSEIGKHPTWPIPASFKPHGKYPTLFVFVIITLTDTGVATSEYYKSLVFATTGKPPVRDAASRQLEFLQVVEALGGIAGFREHLETLSLSAQGAVDATAFTHSIACDIKLDSVQVCTTGTVRAGSYSGELTAWGDATGINPRSVTLHFHAWDQLAWGENKWSVVAASPRELQILFTVDGALVAVAVVPLSSEVDAPQITGTCSWS
jgi:hypothetical protein